MNLPSRVLLVVIAATCSGCIPHVTPRKAVNHAQKYGLAESTSFHELFERAIILTNVVLPDDCTIRLQPTWRRSGMYPEIRFESNPQHPGFHKLLSGAGFDDYCTYENATAIPVYLIDDDQLGSHENTFVPDGEKCVFVNVRTVREILDYFGVGEKTRMSQYSSYEEACVFSAILLHEIGHLHFGDSGSYTEPALLTDVSARSMGNDRATSEIRADRFAIEQIRGALDADEWRPFLSLGTGRSSIANHMMYVINIAVNTYDYRNDPWGYLDHKPRLNLFASKGYSHLDIQLRLLIMLYQLEPDEIRRANLRQLLGSQVDDQFKPPVVRK